MHCEYIFFFQNFHTHIFSYSNNRIYPSKNSRKPILTLSAQPVRRTFELQIIELSGIRKKQRISFVAKIAPQTRKPAFQNTMQTILQVRSNCDLVYYKRKKHEANNREDEGDLKFVHVSYRSHRKVEFEPPQCYI